MKHSHVKHTDSTLSYRSSDFTALQRTPPLQKAAASSAGLPQALPLPERRGTEGLSCWVGHQGWAPLPKDAATRFV